MKNLCAAAAAISLLASSALADPSQNASMAPLAPGKPSGLQKAQDASDNTVLYIVGIGVVAAGIALAVSGNGNSNLNSGTLPPTTTTTTTT